MQKSAVELGNVPFVECFSHHARTSEAEVGHSSGQHAGDTSDIPDEENIELRQVYISPFRPAFVSRANTWMAILTFRKTVTAASYKGN